MTGGGEDGRTMEGFRRRVWEAILRTTIPGEVGAAIPPAQIFPEQFGRVTTEDTEYAETGLQLKPSDQSLFFRGFRVFRGSKE
jgi:hypothetical protein